MPGVRSGGHGGYRAGTGFGWNSARLTSSGSSLTRSRSSAAISSTGVLSPKDAFQPLSGVASLPGV
jgi:hypothetical protein